MALILAYPNSGQPMPILDALQLLRRDELSATPESIAAAKEANARERAEVERSTLEYDLRRNNAIDHLALLVDEFGISRVRVWIENVADLKGLA